MSWLAPSRTRFSFSVLAIATIFALALSASAQKYSQTNLVSDVPGWAAALDPNLVNSWGMASSPASPVWVSDNGTGLSTLYTGSGSIIPLVVTIAPPKDATGPAAPTGVVFNGGGNFNVRSHDKVGSSLFIFDTEDGTISGWSPSVDSTHSIIAVDNSRSGAVYKGLAIGTNSNGAFIYATNFRSGWVEMYDWNFKWQKSFTDTDLPAGYAPFGIANINNMLYVTFALQDDAKHDDVSGAGHGFVDIFDLNGNKVKRLISRGALNSPWGLAWAPSKFGVLSGALLVGNFGNGWVNAYDPLTGASRGHMLLPNGAPVAIDGLWGLRFGNGGAAGPTNTLLFTAGPEKESHGLLGTLTPF